MFCFLEDGFINNNNNKTVQFSLGIFIYSRGAIGESKEYM